MLWDAIGNEKQNCSILYDKHSVEDFAALINRASNYMKNVPNVIEFIPIECEFLRPNGYHLKSSNME